MCSVFWLTAVLRVHSVVEDAGEEAAVVDRSSEAVVVGGPLEVPGVAGLAGAAVVRTVY